MSLSCIALTVAGTAMAVVMICTANHMPSKSSWTISLLVAAAFASSVGVVVTAIYGDMSMSLRFFGATAFLLVCQVVWSLVKGLRPLDFLNPLRGHDTQQH